MKNETIFPQIFPQGDRLPEEFSRYFTGQAYLASISNNEALGTHISNVTFEPGCRNNWHSHTGGQLLLVTAGRGYYQEKGEPARELRPGDVVEIPADVVHWHGAAPDSWFSHLAVECNPAANVNTWLEPVGDAEYEAATAMSWCRPGLSAAAVKNAEMWFPGEAPAFVKTDPELAEVFGNFAFDEVQRYGKLDVKTRVLVTMASSLAQQAAATYEMTLRAALANGVAPVAIREVLYQAVPYVGMAKVVDYIALTNDFLEKIYYPIIDTHSDKQHPDGACEPFSDYLHSPVEEAHSCRAVSQYPGCDDHRHTGRNSKYDRQKPAARFGCRHRDQHSEVENSARGTECQRKENT